MYILNQIQGHWKQLNTKFNTIFFKKRLHKTIRIHSIKSIGSKMIWNNFQFKTTILAMYVYSTVIVIIKYGST